MVALLMQIATTSSVRSRSAPPARTPGVTFIRLFQQSIAAGDLDSLLRLYDPEAVLLNQSGEVNTGGAGRRDVLAPLAVAQARFDYTSRQIIQSGDIALRHTDWQVTSPQPRCTYALEVARRHPDGTWRWRIGAPFTVGRRVAS
jgi:ketosteroid isomerase-like protein